MVIPTSILSTEMHKKKITAYKTNMYWVEECHVILCILLSGLWENRDCIAFQEYSQTPLICVISDGGSYISYLSSLHWSLEFLVPRVKNNLVHCPVK